MNNSNFTFISFYLYKGINDQAILIDHDTPAALKAQLLQKNKKK